MTRNEQKGCDDKTPRVTATTDWQPLANKLKVLLDREVVPGQKYRPVDEREFWVRSEKAFDAVQRVQFPPYSEDDLTRVDLEWSSLPATCSMPQGPQWVVGCDTSMNAWLLRVGIEVDPVFGPTYCVRWPSTWPASPRGRGDVVCMQAGTDSSGEMFPTSWFLQVQALDLAESELGLHGMIDIRGHFVLPCVYDDFSRVQGVLMPLPKTMAPSLPDGRIQDWMFAGVRLPDQEPQDTYGRDVCDVIEVWSGSRVNPPGTKALKKTVAWGYFQITPDSTAQGDPNAGSEVGLMLATQAHPPEMRWREIDDNTPNPAAAALCARTGLWGYVGSLGQTVIEPQFSAAKRFSYDWAIVELPLNDSRLQHGGKGRAGAIAIDKKSLSKRPLSADFPLLPWHWILEPVWRSVIDEFEGHFTVQGEDGLWGMVTPNGKPVIPFKEVDIEVGNFGLHKVHTTCRERFSQLQCRRLVDWLLEIIEDSKYPGLLAPMAGRLFSSWAMNDYGSLPHMELSVRVTMDVIGMAWMSHQQWNPYSFGKGTVFNWNLARRTHVDSVNLSTHAPLDGKLPPDVEVACIPWGALELVIPQPRQCRRGGLYQPDPIEAQADHAQERAIFKRWEPSELLEATKLLIKALDGWNEWLYQHRVVPHPDNPSAADRHVASCHGLPQPLPKWDAEDAFTCTGTLTSFLRRITLAVALHDMNSWHWRGEEIRLKLDQCDLPSLLTPERYATPCLIASSCRQLWIANDQSPAAIPAHHPWVVEMQPYRCMTLVAYNAWIDKLAKSNCPASQTDSIQQV